MYCVINITTKVELNSFQQELSAHISNQTPISDVYNKTSLSAFPAMEKQYFHAKESSKVNYLFAREDANSFRVFIEGAVKRENLDQLTSGAADVYKILARFFDKKKLKYELRAAIWAEGEEILHGNVMSYGQRLRELIFDVPVSIYILVLTLLYTLIRPTDGPDKLTQGVINVVAAIAGFILWGVIKAALRKTELSFKIKKNGN